MKIFELILIAIGLSMDAFAVAICKGFATPTFKRKNIFIIGAWFGSFQMLMPIIGFFVGIYFVDLVRDIDHWIAFVLLGFLGIRMIRESLEGDVCDVRANDRLNISDMFILSLATSIDALAVGITFAILSVNILSSSLIIGITTFVLSALGVYLGHRFGAIFKSKAELLGGFLLIFIGFRILISHLIDHYGMFIS